MGEQDGIKALLQHHLRIRHLVLLTAIAEQGSLLRAASSLNVTQSATTRALRELEDSLKIRLFTRSSRGVTPTVFGQTLIDHAKAILGEIRYAADDLADLKTGSTGRVVIGTLRAAAPALLPRALVQFRAAHPSVALTVLEGTFSALNPALRTGEIDFIVGYLSEFRPRQGLAQERLYLDSVAIVVRRGHPLQARKKRLTLAAVKDRQWVLPLPGTILRRYVDAAFRAAGFESPTWSIESITTTLIQSLLLQSDMIAALPFQVALQFEKFGLFSILPIKIAGPGLPVGITMRAGHALTPAARALVDILRHVSKDVGGKSE